MESLNFTQELEKGFQELDKANAALEFVESGLYEKSLEDDTANSLAIFTLESMDVSLEAGSSIEAAARKVWEFLKSILNKFDNWLDGAAEKLFDKLYMSSRRLTRDFDKLLGDYAGNKLLQINTYNAAELAGLRTEWCAGGYNHNDLFVAVSDIGPNANLSSHSELYNNMTPWARGETDKDAIYAIGDKLFIFGKEGKLKVDKITSVKRTIQKVSVHSIKSQLESFEKNLSNYNVVYRKVKTLTKASARDLQLSELTRAELLAAKAAHELQSKKLKLLLQLIIEFNAANQHLYAETVKAVAEDKQ